MEKIHILTDSSSDIPHDLVEAHGIEIVPIMLTHEGRSFREYYDITSEDYCRLLESSSEIPGTAMTTPTVSSSPTTVHLSAAARICWQCSSTAAARVPIRRPALQNPCSRRSRVRAK